MTDDRMALIEAFQKADDGNFLRSLAETVLQILMEADVDGLIGAGCYERSGERSTYRNGYRERSLDTRLGSLNLKIPSCAPAVTFLASWSQGRPSDQRWLRWSRRRGSHLRIVAVPIPGKKTVAFKPENG